MNLTLYYIIQFVLGGSIIVAMSYLSKHVDPKYAAIIYAMPIQFVLAASLIYFGTDKRTIQDLTLNSIYYLIIFLIFILIFYYLINKYSFWTSLSSSLIIFFILVLIILNITS